MKFQILSLQFIEPKTIRSPSWKKAYPRKDYYYSYKAQWYSTSKYIYGQTHLTANKQKIWLLTKQQRQKAKEKSNYKMMCQVHWVMCLLLPIHPTEHIVCHLLCCRWVNPRARGTEAHAHFSLSWALLFTLHFQFFLLYQCCYLKQGNI